MYNVYNITVSVIKDVNLMIQVFGVQFDLKLGISFIFSFS